MNGLNILGTALLMLTMVTSSYSQSTFNTRIEFDIPTRYSVTEDRGNRVIYQSSNGETFGYSIGQSMTEEEMDAVAVLTTQKLSESLSGFTLIHHSNETVIMNRNYILLVYSAISGGTESYNTILLTMVSGKLITFNYSCPMISAEDMLPGLQDIMNSVRYVRS